VSMRIVRTIAELRVALKSIRDLSHSVGFVPTMGYLHEGHAALIRQSTARCDTTVVSVFVNPTQFGPSEDLTNYPRDLERDQNLCLKLGVKLLFMPEPSEVYPTGCTTFVDPGHLGEVLCGNYRPGHFRGVATIVTKLFNMVQPDLAFFGQKDLQQLTIIRRVMKDLNLPVDVVMIPTVREPDGLALSSRNSYLSPEGRKRATCISRGLLAAQEAFQNSEYRVQTLLDLAKAEMTGLDEIQYLEIVDAHSLDSLVGSITRPAAVCVAAFVDGTRLIDNVLLSPSSEDTQALSYPGLN
jgi:pantoate--beta-alanine ligase